MVDDGLVVDSYFPLVCIMDTFPSAADYAVADHISAANFMIGDIDTDKVTVGTDQPFRILLGGGVAPFTSQY